MNSQELRAAVSKIYTDYWNNKTDGQGMQQAIVDLVEQEVQAAKKEAAGDYSVERAYEQGYHDGLSQRDD